jgi:hypothetical protein
MTKPKEPWIGMDGRPLGPAYEAIDDMLAEHRFEDAITAIERLAATDAMAAIYTMGLTEKAASAAYAKGRPDLAKRLADLAVRGAREYASGATSGAEGIALMHDYEQLVQRLARFR